MRDQKQKKVLEHLKEHGSITSLIAFEKYRATRLSSIINRLRKKYDIRTIMTRNGDSAPFATYVFLGAHKLFF